MTLQLSAWVSILLSFPVVYFLISYLYLARWHRSLFLLKRVVHENGRLTLLGSLFYFDHFVACVPMIALFAFCSAGGFALAAHSPAHADSLRAMTTAAILLPSAILFVLVAFALSLHKVGWQRTLDYAAQRIERDGVMSKGGNWNQLQLSNVPIALGTIGLSITFLIGEGGNEPAGQCSLIAGGMASLGLATLLCVGMTALNWCGWHSFLNPRWLAHSIREIAMYPLTGIPIALSSVLLVEGYLSGVSTLTMALRSTSLILFGVGIAILCCQLALLRRANVLSIAQRPPFAPNGLSIPYLLCSHVFEHFLDFVLIGPLAGGLYAFLRFLSCKGS